MSELHGGPLRKVPMPAMLGMLLERGLRGRFVFVDDHRSARIFIDGGQVTFAACHAKRGLDALECIALLMLDADFEFSRGFAASSNETAGSVSPEILPSVLADLERRQRVLVEVIPNLGAFPRIAAVAGPRPVELDELAIDVLRQIDGTRSIDEIVDALSGQARVLERLAALVRCGLIELCQTPLTVAPRLANSAENTATSPHQETPFAALGSAAPGQPRLSTSAAAPPTQLTSSEPAVAVRPASPSPAPTPVALSESAVPSLPSPIAADPAAASIRGAVVICALVCLGVVLGEIFATYVGPRAGALVDLGVVFGLVALNLARPRVDSRLTLGLALAPLVRIIDLALSPTAADSVGGLVVVALVVLLIGRELLVAIGPRFQHLAGKLLIVIAPLFVLFTILAGTRVIPLFHSG